MEPGGGGSLGGGGDADMMMSLGDIEKQGYFDSPSAGAGGVQMANDHHHNQHSGNSDDLTENVLAANAMMFPIEAHNRY